MRVEWLLGVLAIGASVACGGTDSSGSGRAAGPSPGPMAQAFDASAAANGVPRDLLVAMAQVEGALALPRLRDVAPENPVPAAGPLALRRGRLDTLARGAALVGAPELALRRDADLALEAGARVLAEVGARTGARAGDLASWSDAVEEMSGYADAPHRRDYARRVYAVLQAGGSFAARDGEAVTLAPRDVPLPLALEIPMAAAEYPGAEWFPTSCSGKCDTTRGGNAVSMIVIHDTEGGWDASVATLQNDPGKSVQYIVGTDGKVGQFVPESYTAWHAGNYFVNQRSVGIEHVGYATQPFTEAQYAASAQLVSYLASKYGVAKDRAHVIGHDQVPDGNLISESAAPCGDAPATCEASADYGGADNHRDPGDWEWPTYMVRFGGQAKCDDAHPLWNCSADHTKAIRCAGGVVEVEACDGAGRCESQPLGVDDICHQATGTKDAGAADGGSKLDAGGGARSDAGRGADAGGEIDAAGGGSVTPDPGLSGTAATSPGGGGSVSSEASGGCAMGPGGRSGAPGFLLGLGLAGVLARRRRRRS